MRLFLSPSHCNMLGNNKDAAISMYRTRLNFLLLFILVLPTTLRSEVPPGGEDDILRPVPYTLHIGPYLGGGWVLSQGEFQTLCDCSYGQGGGLGFQLGFFADYPLSKDLSVLVTLGYRLMQPSFDKEESRIEFIETSPGNGDFMEIDFGLETTVRVSSIELGVFGKWNLPLRGLYLAAGPEIGYVIEDNIKETETIVTPGIGYETHGGRDQVTMDDALDRYYDDAVLRLALAGRLGYIIPVTDRLAIVPELSLMMSLTPVVSDFNDWRLNAFDARVYLRFAI